MIDYIIEVFNLKIAMVITDLCIGGAEHVVVNLATALANRGHKVIICYLTGKAEVLPSNSDIEIVSIGMTGVKHIFKAYISLKRVMQNFKPDVIHSHMVHANILARLLRLTIKTPRLISTAHSNYEGGKLRMMAYRATDFLATMSTNVSSQAVESFISQGAAKRGRMISVPNGIDTQKFKLDSIARENIRKQLNIGNRYMLLAIGRLSLEKDYPNLLHSIAILKQMHVDFQLYIIGDGPLKYELKSLAEKLDLLAHLQFLGARMDIPEFLSACDVFVLSSEWEGFGLVVAEAMACERLVAATDCGGVKEILGSADSLVKTKDPLALANKIYDLLKTPTEEYRVLGAQARQRIEKNFSLDATTEKYIELYSQ